MNRQFEAIKKAQEEEKKLKIWRKSDEAKKMIDTLKNLRYNQTTNIEDLPF